MNKEKTNLKVLHLFGDMRAFKIGLWQNKQSIEVHQITMKDPKIYENFCKGKITIHQSKFSTKIYDKIKSKQFMKVFKPFLILYPLYISLLANVVKKHKIDIIHAHRHTGAIVAFLSKKIYNMRDVKIIFDYQDPWSGEDLKKKNLIHKLALEIYFKLEKYIIQNSSITIAQGEEQIELLSERHQIGKEKFNYTLNTTSHKEFSQIIDKNIKKKYNLGEKNILYLGSIINYFGIHLIPPAAKEIVKKYPKAKFIILGVVRDEGYWNEILNYIKKNNLEKNFVIITNSLDQEEIKKIISLCDIGLITHMNGSKICEVAIPTKLFEYLSCGLAVLSSELKHITKFILPTKCGISFEPGNSADLAKKLDILLSNMSDTKKMKKNARKIVEEEYNWDKDMKRMMDSYHKILSF
jgi:glycosyltransferase involved in cell wall biosynthesis